MNCQVWTGEITRNGYPRKGRRMMHREALAARLGRPVAPGMDACHTCDNRACVNPEHIYEGTRKQNMADCTARGRHNKPRGEGHWTAKLSAAEVARIRAQSMAGASRASLAREFGVHPATVSRIARGIWRTEVAA